MKKLIMALSLAITGSAFAGNPAPTDQQPLLGLNFSDIKAACQSPARFHNQIAPTNIQLSCKDQVLRWVPDAPGSYSMPTQRMVTASLISDKYSVSPMTAAVQSAPQVATCAQYKQVAETVETVRAVSCADVLSYAGTSIDFCAATINSLVDANHNAVRSQDTGKRINLCGTAALVDSSNLSGGNQQQQPQPQQPPQQQQQQPVPVPAPAPAPAPAPVAVKR